MTVPQKTRRSSTSSRQHTGIARRPVKGAGVVTLRTPTTLLREKSKESASTSASSSAAKKSTRATETSGDASSSTGNFSERPESPKVDIGPKAYKVYRNGERLVIRFSVEQALRRVIRGRGAYYLRTGNWFVWDMDTGKVAVKTSKTGYTDRQEAVRVAREYRDKYGAYVRFYF